MTGIVWWEIETPAPEAFQEFHGALWGWTFEPAFTGTELGGSDRWLAIIRDPSGISFGLWTPNNLWAGA